MSPSPDSSSKSITIAIIGGGLGGLALAIGLLEHPYIHFHIYEAASAFSEIGAGVMFGPHSVNALRLLHTKALEAFKKCVTYNADENMAKHWPTFRYGGGEKSGSVIYQILPNEKVGTMIDVSGTRPMSSVHRARFLDEFVSILPEGSASFGKALTEVEEVAEGVRMVFGDGSSAVADAVIGCDGIKSRTRASLLPGIEPRYAEEYAYRSLIDAEVVKEIMGKTLGGNAQLWCGSGGYIIHYPVEQGRLINVVAVKRDKDKERKPSYDKLITPTNREDMYEAWRDWDPRLQQLLRKFKTSDKWSLWDLPHDRKYCRGRICLMGDAAHAVVPHLGSGAGMAMEDAYILSNLIGTANGAGDLEKVFEVYDAVRRPRTQKMAWKSREAGIYHSFEKEGVLDDHEHLQNEAETLYSWVWEFDLEASLNEAKEMLAGRV
ncbi:FAD/NAD(P)-binding domain-containing protein [Venturia nashicola]|nr:FAD/NAD(P)-binding domain-containing protein [Venturia nashicola]